MKDLIEKLVAEVLNHLSCSLCDGCEKVVKSSLQTLATEQKKKAIEIVRGKWVGTGKWVGKLDELKGIQALQEVEEALKKEL